MTLGRAKGPRVRQRQSQDDVGGSYQTQEQTVILHKIHPAMYSRARDLLGQIRWRSLSRDVTEDVEQMRAALAEIGATLADIRTSEKEISDLLALGRKEGNSQHNVLESAHAYWKSVQGAITKQAPRAMRTLKCFLKSLNRTVDSHANKSGFLRLL